MKIEICSNVQQVKFIYRPLYSDWKIDVNDEPISCWDRLAQGQMAMAFSGLHAAVRYAKGKDLIPYEFNASSLIENTKIEIST